MKRFMLVVFAVMLAMAAGSAGDVLAQETPIELSLYGGFYDGSHGDWKYWGADGSFFLIDKSMKEGRFRLGPSGNYTGWTGDVENVAYDGHKLLGGGELQYLTAASKTSLKLRFGQKVGGAEVSEADLAVEENNYLLNAELFHQRWWDRTVFGRLLVGVRGDFDVGGEKATRIGGHGAAGDKRKNQSEYGPWLQLDLIQGSWGYLYGGLSLTHRNFDGDNAVESTLGVRLFKEVVELKGGYISGTDNPAWGVGIIVNLHHLKRYM